MSEIVNLPSADVTQLQAWAQKEGVAPATNADTLRVGLSALLYDVRSFLCRYIRFPKDAQAIAVTLWIAHTWAIDAFDFTPYLHIGSPMKQCGKSRLLDCLAVLVKNMWRAISPSEAVLFRKVGKDCPTLLLDEVDTIYTGGRSDENKEGLRALLNAGFQRGASVPRCVPPKFDPVDFPVFCPKALAGIGKLPDTVADRSIHILLARRAKSEVVENFRAREVAAIAQPIVATLKAWGESQSNSDKLRAARPSIPTGLGDRAADICEPLLAIADMAGNGWPDKARRSLVELCAGGVSEDENTAVKLLAAIREIFGEKCVDRISTKDLLESLIARESDEPWAEWWGDKIEKGNVKGAAPKLARMLKPLGIVAGTIREADGATPKGYKLASFEDTFSRYLPEITPQ